MDRLFEDGRRTFDESSRREIYRKVQQRLHELEPISCLYHFASPVLQDARLMGVERSPIGLWATTPGAQAWSWKDSAQAR